MIAVDVPYPDTVDALADALRRDPIVVHETLGGGDTAGALERITRVAAQVPFRAYVAVVDTPAEVDADDAGAYLATALSRRIGKPGIYVVATQDSLTGVRVVGTGWGQTQFDLQAGTDRSTVGYASGPDGLLTPTVDVETILHTAAGDPVSEPGGSDWTEPSLSDAVIEDLVAREVALAPYESPSRSDERAFPLGEQWSAGTRWAAGTTVAALLLAVVLQSLRGWPGWRWRSDPARRVRRARTAPPDLAALRALAEAEVTALAEDLATPAALTAADHVPAVLARETAERLLGSGDLREVVGALVLARGGRHALARSASGADPYRPCFVDPLHGTASAAARWRLGDADVEVPVCPRCVADVDAGRAPTPLVVRRGLRARPYYEEDTVWARTGYGSLTTDLADLVAQVSQVSRAARLSQVPDRRRSR